MFRCRPPKVLTGWYPTLPTLCGHASHEHNLPLGPLKVQHYYNVVDIDPSDDVFTVSLMSGLRQHASLTGWT